MTPEEYCFNKAAPLGSPLYYSLRKVSPAQRRAIVALIAFYQEIETIILEFNDPAVAFTKLNWWYLDLTKLIAHEKPEHPIVVALQKSVSDTPFAVEKLLSMLDSMAQDIQRAPFPTFEDVTLHIIHTAGVRELLIAEVLQLSGLISAEVIYEFTLVLELVRHIQYLRRDVRHGFVFFSQDELKNFNVDLVKLQQYKTTREIHDLLLFQAKKAEHFFQQACEKVSASTQQKYASMIVRCQIALATLREIKKVKFSVLENYICLTPLRYWWIALKMRVF